MEFDQSKCSMRWYGQRETLVACVLFVSVLKTVKRPLLQTFKKWCKVRQLNVLVLFDYSSEIFKKLYHRANSCCELFSWSIEMHNGTLSSIYDEQASSIMKIVSVVNYMHKILVILTINKVKILVNLSLRIFKDIQQVLRSIDVQLNSSRS